MKQLSDYWDGKEGYGSHCPILYELMKHIQGPVLELGCGDFSTPLLCDIAKDDILVSLESEQEWYDQMVTRGYHANPKHSIIYVADWDKMFVEIEQYWTLIFVDHNGTRRVNDALLLKNRCDIMILHDTDADGSGGKYGWKDLWQHFRYRKDFKHGNPVAMPATSIVSNVVDVNDWWKKNVESL